MKQRNRMWKVILFIVSILIISLTFLFLFQHKLIFFPQKTAANYKYKFSMDYGFKEIFFEIDGETIHALLFNSNRKDIQPKANKKRKKVENKKGGIKKKLVIYFHGNAGNLESWGNVAENFLDLQYDVLIYDYRSYGKSTGSLSQDSLFSDARYIYQIIKENYPEYNEENLVLYGRSIGSAIAALLASENSPGKLILESGYLSLYELARTYYPWVPAWVIRFPLETQKYLVKVSSPIYLFHGTNDSLIDHHHSIELHKLTKERSKLILIPGGQHNDLEYFPEYKINLQQILQ